MPFWVILDKSGNLIESSLNAKGENLGFPATEKEVKDFTAILNKTSKLTEQNLNTITKVFLAK
jgi:hypothetical protein